MECWLEASVRSLTAVWWCVSIRVSAGGLLFTKGFTMQISLEELVGELDKISAQESLGVRLFGARPNEINGDPPGTYARKLLGLIRVFELSPRIYGDLARRARTHVKDVGSRFTSILEVKTLAERILPFLREAITSLEMVSDEDFEADEQRKIAPRDELLSRFRTIAVNLETLSGFGEAAAALLEVERSVTLNVRGTQQDVDALVERISTLARQEEAISLGLFAGRVGINVSQCENGHIVILTDEGRWHTDTEITPLIKDTLGDRLLSNEEALEYINELKELLP